MTLKHSQPASWLGKLAKTLRIGLAGTALLAGAGGLTAGCLDRPVTPATPRTSNVYIDQIRQTAVDKIDLLFMIDNSISMADKQAILSDAVPVLVQRLVSPSCINANGETVQRGDGDNCPAGYSEEFNAIRNIHIGVVTSSLGSHGGDQCTTPEKDDFAQLLGSRRAELANLQWDNSGFLVWDNRDAEPGVEPHNPPGIRERGQLNDAFTAHVVAANQNGCGYEASLEAWYRFLIDPQPVLDMTHVGDYSVRGMVNNTVLQQRERFLRSDSLIAIVMLTDENDCSIVDETNSQGWLVSHTGTTANPFRMPRASDGCRTSPNDPCCRLCGIQAPAAGCPDDATDPQCMKGPTHKSNAEDHPNLRCFNQMQRFGVDLLYPTQRYVDGLTKPMIFDQRTGTDVINPLFQPRNNAAARDPGLVFLAGIVGVPWQDIATDDSIEHPTNLTYLTAAELLAQDRWSMILGDPANGVRPTDPHMWEQIEQRPAGTPHPHPLLAGNSAYAIAGADANGQPNAINGHEQNVTGGDDLQYACIFPLDEPYTCDPPAMMGNDVGCDCNSGGEREYNRPLCDYPADTTAEGTQTHAKAYPGLRHLQVLKDIGPQAIVASICPKNTAKPADPAADPNYGYNPAVNAIITRLKEALNQKCLPRPLVPEKGSEQVPCMVVEAMPNATECACNASGRAVLDGERAKIRDAVIERLRNTGQCGEKTGVDCNGFCMCEILQFSGAELEACQAGQEPGAGYCYVDRGPLVEACRATERRILQFTGENVPAKGAIAVIACLGATLSSDTGDDMGTGM